MNKSNGDLSCYNLYINGQWRAPSAEQYRPTIDPSTGETLAMIAQADIEDTRLAIQAARAAFDDGYWAGMSPGERSRLLHAVVDALEARQDEIAEAEMRDGGCTWRKAHLLDIPVGLIHFRHFAKLADMEPLESVPQITFPAMSYNFVVREPIGVCGQIIPWNFPFLMAVWKMAPALAAGNTVVIKPATFTPLSLLKMTEIIAEGETLSESGGDFGDSFPGYGWKVETTPVEVGETETLAGLSGLLRRIELTVHDEQERRTFSLTRIVLRGDR